MTSSGSASAALSSDDAAQSPGQSGAPFPVGLRVLGLLIYAVLGGLSAAFEILLVPTRLGSTLVPVAVLLAVAGNILLPRLSRNFTASAAGAVVPVIAWIVVLVVLSSSRPEGDVLLPGSGTVQFISYGVMLGGLITGLVSVAVIASGPRPRRSQRAGYDESPAE